MSEDETKIIEANLLANSPLREIDRDSLHELFQRMNDYLTRGLPEEIPDQDLDEIIAVYRARRSTFSAEQEKKSQRPKRRARVSVATALATALDGL